MKIRSGRRGVNDFFHAAKFSLVGKGVEGGECDN